MCKFPSYKKTSKRVNIALNASQCKFFPQNSGKFLSEAYDVSPETGKRKILQHKQLWAEITPPKTTLHR